MILFIIFTLFIIISIVLTIIIFIRKPKKFIARATLLQTLFVFFTLWITIFTIRSSNSDTQNLFLNLKEFSTQFSQMESSLDDVSVKLKEMPRQIENFANSIDSLNNGINQQKKDFQANTKDLNKTIKELSASVSGYEQNINNYSQQLKSVVDLTDKQLSIWKEQQRVLLDEFSRKPILKLETKYTIFSNDTCEIVDLIIVNDGNIEANTRVIFLSIPSNGLIEINSTVFKFYKNIDNFSSYRLLPFDYNIDIIAAGSDIIIPCSIKILKKYKDQIAYRIDYYSKYSSGSQIGIIIIK